MNFLIAILATYYISLALTQSEGPYGIFYKLRRATSNLGVFECVMCTSFWVSLLVCVFLFDYWLLYALAVSGAATALDRLTE